MYFEFLAETIRHSSRIISMFAFACRAYTSKEARGFNYMVGELSKELDMAPDEIRYKVIVHERPKLELKEEY